MAITIESVKRANQLWFAPGNASFFGDVSYEVMQGKVSNKPFLVRYTSMWSDMFNQPKTYCYRINEIDPLTLKIGPLNDTHFPDMAAVTDWLSKN